MTVLIIIIIVAVIGIISCTACAEDEFGICTMLNTLLLIVLIPTCLILGTSNKYNSTRIVNQYKSGDYELEIKIGKDKVDTLYIFK